MRTNQKGFSAVEILLIGLIIGVLGFAGFFVYRHSQKQSSPTNKSPSQNTEKTEPITTITVKIPEWNIEFKAPSSLGTLTYKIIDRDLSSLGLGTVPVAYLSTKALDELENGKCAASSYGAYSLTTLGYLFKGDGTFPQPASELDAGNVVGGLSKQFPDFYISQYWAETCRFSEDKNNQLSSDLRNQLTSALNASPSTIEITQ